MDLDHSLLKPDRAVPGEGGSSAVTDSSTHRVRLDTLQHKVWIDSRSITMRRAPFELLAYLVIRRGEWVNQKTLLREVFGARRDYDTALVRVHVHALRRALGEQGRYIESRRGSGYRCSPRLF